MASGMNEQPRTIKICNLLAGTSESIGEGGAYIPSRTSLPASSTDTASPDIPTDLVAVFNSDESLWHLVEDHRGKTVYDVASGNALSTSKLGPLLENVTRLSPGGKFQKWNGITWMRDTKAERLSRIREAEEIKNNLMQVASEHTALLQNTADLGVVTEEGISLLETWKKYRVLLNHVDTSTTQGIEWPALPQGKIYELYNQMYLSIYGKKGDLEDIKHLTPRLFFICQASEVLLWLPKWFVARF